MAVSKFVADKLKQFESLKNLRYSWEGHWQEIADWTAEENVARVAWVGHAPCVGRLVAKAIGDGNASIRMQKGAIASICLDDGISQPGELQWLVTAQVIEAAV